MKLLVRKVIAVLTRPFSLGYSHCERCNRTWNTCEYHVTWYDYNEELFPWRGFFALCEDCWGELAPDKRWEFYRSCLWKCRDLSKQENITTYMKIQTEVLKGK